MTSSIKGMVSSPKPPSILEKIRTSLAASDSASASTSYCGSGGAGVSPSGNRVPERSKGFFPQDGSLPFDLSVRSPNPPSCSESARASLTASNSSNTSHCGSGGREVILIRQEFPERSGGSFPQDVSLPFKSSVSSPKPPYC